jgi:carboxypeptidase Taq
MDAWQTVVDVLEEARLLGGASALLSWDQQTGMPPEAGPERAAQSAMLARLRHERLTDPRVGAALEALEAAPPDDPDRAAAVVNLRRDWNRATRVPPSLVEALVRAESEGFEAWVRAKAARDATSFLPCLRHTLRLQREMAAAIDADRSAYDVLLDDYEPGATEAALRSLFDRLRAALLPLLTDVEARPAAPPLCGPFDLAAQRRVSENLLDALGYPRSAGRLDLAEHPFSTSLGRRDVRITTRFHEDDLLKGLFSTIHECGHALYELGLPHHLQTDLVARAASMGLHESQSRFWENVIGRSRAFASWVAPRLAAAFPGAGIHVDALYGALNRVQRGLVRVDADELTYNLHVLVRFDLEVALVGGTLDVDDLPAAWNAAYRDALGVEPAHDAEGVLQDVHWSVGALGYFPSYALGNLYAASLRRGMESDLPDLWDTVGRGDFAPALAWLRERVHAVGRRRRAAEIVDAAVGPRDAVADLLGHLAERTRA